MDGKNLNSLNARSKFNDYSSEFQFFQTHKNGTTLKDKNQLELKHFDDYQQGIDFFNRESISTKPFPTLTNFSSDFTFNGNNKIDPPPCICAEKIMYDNPCADQIKQIICEINGKPADVESDHSQLKSDRKTSIEETNLTNQSKLIEKVIQDKDLSDLVMMLYKYKDLAQKEINKNPSLHLKTQKVHTVQEFDRI